MQYEREDADALSKVVSKHDLQFLYPLADAEQFLPEALEQVCDSLPCMSCHLNLDDVQTNNLQGSDMAS